MIGKEAADRSVEAVIRLSASNVRMFSQTELIRGAVKMASTNGLTVYDALYLALAKTLNAPLLSLDLRLAEAAEKAGVRVLRGAFQEGAVRETAAAVRREPPAAST